MNTGECPSHRKGLSRTNDQDQDPIALQDVDKNDNSSSGPSELHQRPIMKDGDAA